MNRIIQSPGQIQGSGAAAGLPEAAVWGLKHISWSQRVIHPSCCWNPLKEDLKSFDQANGRKRVSGLSPHDVGIRISEDASLNPDKILLQMDLRAGSASWRPCEENAVEQCLKLTMRQGRRAG